MTLAKKLEEVLKRNLKSENIKTVVDLVEFLKYKEDQIRWHQINESEHEYITEEEENDIDKAKYEGEYISEEDLLKELGINKDEV